MRRRPAISVLAAAVVVLGAARYVGGEFGEPVSAFAAGVGTRDPSSDAALAVTVYVVPDGRTLLLTNLLVANHGQEVGPLYLSDSRHTRCSVELLETTLRPGDLGDFSTLRNTHVTFGSGIPFGPGEPVVATLAGGTRGVDVTITGNLIPGPHRSGVIRLPGGARGKPEERAE